MTPLGSPVVPDVKRMIAQSEAEELSTNPSPLYDLRIDETLF
jgi:hypothetical protein